MYWVLYSFHSMFPISYSYVLPILPKSLSTFHWKAPNNICMFLTATLHNSLLYHHLLTSRNPVIARSYKFKKRELCRSVFLEEIFQKRKNREAVLDDIWYIWCVPYWTFCVKSLAFCLNLVWLQSRGFGNLIITPAAPFWRWLWNKYIYGRPFSH